MIKRICALCLCACALVLQLAACGSTESGELVGRWIPSTAGINGEAVQYGDLGLDEDSFYFEFASDGTFSAAIAGLEESGEYTFNETSVDLIFKNKTEKMLYDNGSLTYSIEYGSSDTYFVFVKETSR